MRRLCKMTRYKDREPTIPQAVKIKGCLHCGGDLAWQYNEWTCIQCGRTEIQTRRANVEKHNRPNW